MCVLNVLNVRAEQAPYKETSPSTQGNFERIYTLMESHRHTGEDGTQKIDPMIPPSAGDIDDAITSEKAGQLIFNTTGLEVCISTQAASSTAWVKLHSPTTACAN